MESEEINDKYSKYKKKQNLESQQAIYYEMASKSFNEHSELLKTFVNKLKIIANPSEDLLVEDLQTSLDIIEQIRKLDFHFLKIEQLSLQYIIYFTHLIHRKVILDLNEEYKETLKKSEIYRSLSENQKQEIFNIFDKLSKTNLGNVFYYPEYKNIYDNKVYTDDEMHKAIDVGIKDITSWDFAFFILSKRNEKNKHYMSLFKDNNDVLDVNDIHSILRFSKSFYSAFNTWQHRKKHNS